MVLCLFLDERLPVFAYEACARISSRENHVLFVRPGSQKGQEVFSWNIVHSFGLADNEKVVATK